MTRKSRHLVIATIVIGAAAAVALPFGLIGCPASNCGRAESVWEFSSDPSRRLVEFPTQEGLAIAPRW